MRRGGAKSFVDDLVLGRGVVLSRAATSLRSIETQPWTRRFVCFLDRQIIPGSQRQALPPLSLSLCLSRARARGEEGGGSAVLLLLLVLLLRLKGETCLPPPCFFFFFFFFLWVKGETLRKKSSAGRGGSSWDSLKVGKKK